MHDPELLSTLMDSLKDPYVFADMNHIIRYMNKTAIIRYKRRGGESLIGRSLLDCHNGKSRTAIKEVLTRLQDGEEEVMTADTAKHRLYMRAVRDDNGSLLGYYERYEPPVKEKASKNKSVGQCVML